jgi:hypothetical protein
VCKAKPSVVLNCSPVDVKLPPGVRGASANPVLALQLLASKAHFSPEGRPRGVSVPALSSNGSWQGF